MPIYNQIGIQNSNKEPTRIPPARKLFQARKARIARIEPLQIISNVVMGTIYNETGSRCMGSNPYMTEGIAYRPLLP
jgi:hypothetical protein